MKNVGEMRSIISEMFRHRNNVKEALDTKDQKWLNFSIGEIEKDLSRLKQANKEQQA
jgi:hypothetical protein